MTFIPPDDIDLERRRRLTESVEHLRAIAPGDDGADAERARRELVEGWNTKIPKRFRLAQLPDVEEPAASELFDWASGRPHTNLVLLGPVGVGKTHAAVGALRVCHEHGWTIMFAPVVEVLDLLRPGGPPDISSKLGSVKVLLLDDVGAERPTDWTAEQLYGIVNRRWLNELPTIVTTNVSPDELERSMDPRLFSRLVHNAVAVRIGGPDRRRA